MQSRVRGQWVSARAVFCGSALFIALPLAGRTPDSATTCNAADARTRALAADRAGNRGYAGRYGAGSDMIVVAPCGASLVAWPILSANGALLTAAGRDTFAFVERPERMIAFRRDADSGVTAMTRVGTDRWLARADTALGVIDLLLAGRAGDAARHVSRADPQSVDAAVALGNRVRATFPSLRPAVFELLVRLGIIARPTPELSIAYGDALVSGGKMAEAHAAYERAATSDSARQRLASRLRMTAPAVPGEAGALIDLDAVFRPPTTAEEGAVRADWKGRDATPRDVREVYRTSLRFAGKQRDAAVIAFNVGARREYGVVLPPVRRQATCCAIVVDIKGTTPDYQPLDFSSLPRSIRELGPAADDVMIVLPGIRGERIVIGDSIFVSNGDRRNGWDGGADDARAALGAAESLYKVTDTTRVCALGHSRGATVALLAAERDTRFKCVVAEAAPVDWFALMSEDGWPLPIAVREGLASRSTPGQIGGQFIERFLAPVRDSGWTLAQVRHRMLASSPLYFTASLPPTLAIFGADDASVPMPNGKALATALHGRVGTRVRLQAAVGHDLDPVETPVLAGAFLREALGLAPVQQ